MVGIGVEGGGVAVRTVVGVGVGVGSVTISVIEALHDGRSVCESQVVMPLLVLSKPVQRPVFPQMAGAPPQSALLAQVR